MGQLGCAAIRSLVFSHFQPVISRYTSLEGTSDLNRPGFPETPNFERMES